MDKGKSRIIQNLSAIYNRLTFALKYGLQYRGNRNIYRSLGYPENDENLDFEYFFPKYERQDIATAVIDKPRNATWTGGIDIVSENEKISQEWIDLEKKYNVRQALNNLDKLAGIGRYAVLLFGFSDTATRQDWKRPVTGKMELNYIKAYPETTAIIDEMEKNNKSERYGKPLFYKIITANNDGSTNDFVVHYSRVLHVNNGSLISDIYGTPSLKPILNRLLDLEKLVGGDAEMFWRGARPGYTATPKDDYEMSDEAEQALDEELTKYEHDLRRFITAAGVDIKALEQQVSDPLNHVDVQIQLISAQTGIPKRILMGSERGELASTQDKEHWLNMIDTRRKEFAEPVLLRPFIDKCMKHGIMTEAEYMVLWSDIFAPSESQKIEIGMKRAEALKIYTESVGAMDTIPPEVAYKYILGFDKNQISEIEQAIQDMTIEDDE